MNATKKSYEAPAISVNGKFVAETRKLITGPAETEDVLVQYGAGSVGFGL
jgi:hypothetical protein